MMRTMLAILAFSPAMLFAQGTTPAQPVSTPVLQSSAAQPAELAALKSVDNAKTAASPLRVTTGVVAPALLTDPQAEAQDLAPAAALRLKRTVVVDLTVDATGKPTDLKVVESAGQYTDEDAVAAISKYRFKPGTLDGQPTAVPMRLRYVIQRSAFSN